MLHRCTDNQHEPTGMSENRSHTTQNVTQYLYLLMSKCSTREGQGTEYMRPIEHATEHTDFRKKSHRNTLTYYIPEMSAVVLIALSLWN